MDTKTRELLNSLKQAPVAPAAQPVPEWKPGGVISEEAFAPPAPPKRVAAPKSVAPKADKTTEEKRSAARDEPVTPPVLEATPKPQMDPDLLEDLAPVLGEYYKRAQRAADVDQALDLAKDLTKADPARVKKLAAIQGVDLEDMAKQARAGTTFEAYKQAKKDVIGFQAPEVRETEFNRVVGDFEKAQKGEASTERRELTPATEPSAWTPLTKGYVVGGTQPEEVIETAKPGEHQYAIAEELFKTLAKDEEWSHIYDLYGRQMTGGATLQYINDRSQQIMKNRGIVLGSPNADEEADKARRQATNEVLAMKTIGMWTPGIFLQDVQATEGAKAPGLLAAFGPNVELVGFNNRGMAVYRQESPLGTGLRAIDTIGVLPYLKFKGVSLPIPGQAPLVGMLTRKGEGLIPKEGEETYGEAAARGIQTGANFVEYALEKTEGSSAPARYAAAAAGLGAAMLYPDAFQALGAATKSARAGLDLYAARKLAKEAEPLLRKIVEAYKANDFAAAKAAEQALRDSANLRRGHTSIIQMYLDGDAAVIEMMRALDPDVSSVNPGLFGELIGVGLRESPELAEELYEVAGKGRPYLHFSVNAPSSAAKEADRTGDTVASFLEAGNFQQHLDRIKKARDIYLRKVPKTSAIAAENAVDGVIKGAKDDAVAAWQAGAEASATTGFDAAFAALIENNKAAILADPAAALGTNGVIQTALKNDPVFRGGKYDKARATVYSKTLPKLKYRLTNLATNPIQGIVARDLKVFDRMEQAVRDNIKSRIFAAEALRRELSSQGKLRVTPIDLANEIAHGISAGGQPLSPFAEMYFKKIVHDLPEDAKLAEGMKRSDFFTKLQNLDTVLSAVARRNKRTLAEEYRNFFRIRLEKAEEAAREGRALDGVPLPPSPDEIKVPSVAEAVADAERVKAAPKDAAKEDAAVEAAAAKLGGAVKPKVHPNAAQLLSRLPDAAGVTEAEASRVLSALDRIKPGAEFTKKSVVPGVSDAKFVAMRDALVDEGKVAQLEDGKFIRTVEETVAPKVAPAPAAAPAVAPSAPIKETPQQALERLRAEAAARRAPARAEAAAADQVRLAEAARAKQEFEAGLAAQAKPIAKPAAAPVAPAEKVVEAAVEEAPVAEKAVEEAAPATKAAEEAAPVARKAKGFSDKNSLNAGVYEVEVGGQTRRFFRDTKEGPLGAVWVEDTAGTAGMPITFLGNTKDDAIKALQRKYVAEAPAAEKVVEEAAVAAPATPSGIPAVVEAPVVAENIVEAAPVAKTPEALLTQVKSLTHSMPGSSNSVVFGTVEGGTFTPKFVLAADSVGNPTRIAEAIAAQATEALTDIPEAMKVDDAANLTPFSPGLIIKKLDKMNAEGSLFQVGPTGPGTQAVAKGAFDFDPLTGRGVATLFTGRFDPSTITHELGHYIRRTALDADEMESITKYVKSKGINVEHKFGDFIGDVDEIEKAEEAFAEAYEVYLATGRAPTTPLQGIFAKIKEVFAALYRSARNGASGKDIPEEVRAVFDKLYSDVPDAPIESTFDLVYREGMQRQSTELPGALDVLSTELTRRGIPKASVAELGERMKEFIKVNPSGQFDTAVAFDFPVPVFGRTKWTGADIKALQKTIDLRQAERNLTPLKAAMFGDQSEVTMTEQLYRSLENMPENNKVQVLAKTVLTYIVKSQIGGDIVGERALRSLPPEMRKNILTGARIIEQGQVDVIAMVNETITTKDFTRLEDYLAGADNMTFLSGRRVASSGQELTGGFLRLFTNAYEALNEDERFILQQFAETMNRRGTLPSTALMNLPYPDFKDAVLAAEKAAKKAKITDPAAVRKLVGEAMDEARKKYANDLLGQNGALRKFLGLVGSGEGQVGPQLAQALDAMRSAPGKIAFNEFRFAETLLFASGSTPRNGAFATLNNLSDARSVTRLLLEEAQNIYGVVGTAKGEEFARRLAVLVGTYGTVSLAKSQYQTLGVILKSEEVSALRRWVDAYDITPEMRVSLDTLTKKFGTNTDFVADTILGADVYIPKAARQIIADALARAQFNEAKLTKAGDIYQAVMSWTKKRMTRGNLVIKPRYYHVNTVDHFHQASLEFGYGNAARSASRVAFQTVLMTPVTGQAFETAMRIGAKATGNDAWLRATEKLRDVLQTLGDAVTQPLGEWFSVSKYRIEVNRVLEGSKDMIVLGGRVTSYEDIKRTFIAEGIFAGHDTRMLGQAIRREGSMFITSGNTLSTNTASGPVASAVARVVDAAADLTINVVDDLGECWGERERIGAAITLMESGADARVAARLVIDALYDYSQSMTKADRNMLVGGIFPFWAFQKNANQQFINKLFTAEGAYRMMVLKKFRDRATQLVSEIYYNEVGGELGIDVKSMPEDMQDYYYSIMTKAHEIYGPNLPADVAVALRMIMTGRSSEVVDGKYVELDEELMRRMQAGAFFPGAAMQAYAMPLKGKSGLPSYVRDRPGVMFVQRRDAITRHFMALRGSNEDYYYAMLPESSVETAMKHTATSAAVILRMIALTARAVPGGPVLDLQAAGIEGTGILTAIQPVIDLERSPVAGPIINLYVADRGYPERLSPWLASFMQKTMDMEIVQVPADMDPFADGAPVRVGDVDENGEPKDFLTIMGEDYVKRVQEMNQADIDLNDAETVRKRRFYLAPGAQSLAFQNFPVLGELNQYFMKMERLPMEQRGQALDDAMYLLRAYAGFDVAEVSPTKTAIREEPVTYQKTKKPF